MTSAFGPVQKVGSPPSQSILSTKTIDQRPLIIKEFLGEKSLASETFRWAGGPIGWLAHTTVSFNNKTNWREAAQLSFQDNHF